MQIILTTLALGILLAIITSLFWNIAPILQKEALQKMKEIKVGEAVSLTDDLFRNRRWLLGALIATFGGATYIAATEMAGIVVVQPLMSTGLVALAIVSSRKFGEIIDTRAIVGILLLMLTPVFIGLSNVTEPIMFLTYDAIIVYSIAMLVLLALIMPLARKITILWAIITSILQALAALYTQWFTLAIFEADNYVQGLIDSIIPISVTAICTFIAAVYAVSIGLQRNPPVRFGSIVSTTTMFAVIFGGILIYGQVLTNIFYYAIGLGFGIIGIVLLGRFQEATKVEK